MDFPSAELMDEPARYAKLVGWLHPEGLACPRCEEREHLTVHRRPRDPVLNYRCLSCQRVFNGFTETLLHGVRRRPSVLVLIVRGIAQGVSTRGSLPSAIR
jgi:transposase-like protein